MRALPILAVVWASLPSVAAAHGRVEVWVDAPANLADTPEPMPALWVHNDSRAAIEFYAFHGVPDSFLERERAGVFEAGDPGNKCGDGFVRQRLDPGAIETYPLWSLIGHGPGTSGRFRVVFPYTTKRDGRWRERRAVGDPFTLAYGDVPPAFPATAPREAQVVVLSATWEGKDKPSPPPTGLAVEMLPAARACVAAAQRRLPWLRGPFTMVAYRFAARDRAKSYVSASLIGDADANRCLESLSPPPTIQGEYRLTFAVTPG